MTYPFRDPTPILAVAEVPAASDPRQTLADAGTGTPWPVTALIVGALVVGIGCLILGAASEADRRWPSFHVASDAPCVCGHVGHIHDKATGTCVAASGCLCTEYRPVAVSR